MNGKKYKTKVLFVIPLHIKRWHRQFEYNFVYLPIALVVYPFSAAYAWYFFASPEEEEDVEEEEEEEEKPEKEKKNWIYQTIRGLLPKKSVITVFYVH